MNTASDKNYAEDYSEDSFWLKIKDYAKTIGREIAEQALCMYYAIKDQDTPMWARAVMVGALGYFISPIDAIPDIIPVVGLSDDIGVLAAAIGMVLVHIKPEHREAAKAKAGEWFD